MTASLAVLDASAKVRSMVERANAAVDVAFLRGASTSLQRYTYVQEEYVGPAVEAAEAFHAMCSFSYGPMVSPFVFFLPLSTPILEAAQALRSRYESAITGALSDEIAAQGALITAALAKAKREEEGFMSTSLTYMEARALDGLNMARDSAAWIERNLGVTLKTVQVGAQEIGETTRFAIGTAGDVAETTILEAGETIQTGIKTAGKTAGDIADAARDALIKGLLIWAGIALAGLLALIVIVPPLLRVVTVV